MSGGRAGRARVRSLPRCRGRRPARDRNIRREQAFPHRSRRLASSWHDVPMRPAGIVLAGGRSTRMGTPKAWLEWHGTTLLDRVVRVVSRAVDGGPVVVVRAPGQDLPELPAGVLVVDDAAEGQGPLEGLAAG